MKFLFLSQGFKVENQPGYDLALRNAKYMGESIEYKNIPYLALGRELGWTNAWNYLLKINEDYSPDVIFFQFFHGNETSLTDEFFIALKTAKNKPLLMGSIGDLFHIGRGMEWTRKYSSSCLILCKHADAMFSITMGSAAEYLSRQGCRNIIFLPHAFSLAHFSLGEPQLGNKEVKHRVVMLASPKFSLKSFIRTFCCFDLNELKVCIKRYILAFKLRNYFKDDFGLYGKSWRLLKNGGPIRFRDQCELFKSSSVVVDGEPPYAGVYYASDRPFFVAGSGTPLVAFYTPRFEKMFRENEHIYFIRKYADVTKVCNKVLSLDEAVQLARRKSTIDLIRTRHLIEHRVDTIMSTIEAINLHRSGQCTLENALRHIRMWHFLPEVDLEEEYHFAVCNWQG